MLDGQVRRAEPQALAEMAARLRAALANSAAS
jgi:hypothetical protein